MPRFTRIPLALQGDEARIARESGRRVSAHCAGGQAPEATLSINGETLALPPSAMPLLAAILGELGQGHGVALTPVGAEVTVAQAGEILDESGERILRLVRDGKLPERDGKIPLAAVLDHMRHEDEARSVALAEMVALSQELNLP